MEDRSIILDDAFTFYVCNPDCARELLQQTRAHKDALAGLRGEFTEAEIDAMAVAAAAEQLEHDYPEEYQAARDALESLGEATA